MSSSSPSSTSSSNPSAISPDLIVFGSIVQDLVSYVERFPKPGESVRGQSFKTFCGGKGANQAVMAAKMGTKVAMVGMVGDDMFADENLRSIAASGADVSLVQKLEGQSTGTASIYVSGTGENCIVVTLGANHQLGAARARAIDEQVARARMVLCQQEIDQAGTLELFRIAKRHGVTTFFNPAPGTPDLDRNILPLCDLICTNENETEFLTGLPMNTVEEAKAAAMRMLDFGPRLAIVTMGPKGAVIAQRGNDPLTKTTTKNGQIRVDTVEAPKVTAVDTTGAGDCFCGSLAHFIVAHPDGDVVDHVRRAVQIAAMSVQKKGTQASYPSREELQALGLL